LQEWGEMLKDPWLKEEGQKIALELLVKLTEEASKKPSLTSDDELWLRSITDRFQLLYGC